MNDLIKDMDKPLLVVSLIMFIFGLINIVNASSREAVVQRNVSMFHYFIQQSKMLIVGLVASLVIINIPTKKYYKLILWALFILIGISIYLLIYGNPINGSKNWIALFGISFQPSEFSKPVIIIALSLLFERLYKPLINKNIKHFDIIGIILAVGLIIPFIVILQEDFGTAGIMIAIFLVMFIVSPILKEDKYKTILTLTGVSVFSFLIAISVSGKFLSTEKMERLTSFINPCEKYENGGYQTCNGYIAINDGGLFGLGIGNSKQKYSYIPEPHTDSVFAIIAEEMGLLGSTFIFVFYILILDRILKISSRANNIRGKYMSMGIAVYIFMHIFINLGGLFGLIPLTGVPLPFLSYGGSFTISLMVSLAVVQRIHIEMKNEMIKF